MREHLQVTQQLLSNIIRGPSGGGVRLRAGDQHGYLAMHNTGACEDVVQEPADNRTHVSASSKHHSAATVQQRTSSCLQTYSEAGCNPFLGTLASTTNTIPRALVR